MKYGYIRNDDDGHNYLVPEEKIAEFDKAMSAIEESEYRFDDPKQWDLENDFNNKFWQYSCDGLSDFKVVMPDEVNDA